ncbi:prolactin-8A8-like isoform X1 [Grammomys surdaster]|uniref:prolactin-8A8-like isoform X1 n=1 Tax=Grammomys surdaster TaxID=491861 RepID=UPI0010A01FCB|nr:prolactin-8A8-like isoform X1 [Grammomys surdaster]
MLPLSQPHFSGALLLLVVSNLLLWEKTASIPECHPEEGRCWNPLVNTFNNAIQRAEVIHVLAEQMHEEFYHNPFSSGQFTKLVARMFRRDQAVLRARNHCHSNSTNPPDHGPEHENIKTKKYLKTLINYVGSWISPLFHLVLELRAMQDVPEVILSKAKEIEENNREILEDLRWILTQVYPTAKIKEKFPSWEYLPSIKSNDKSDKFLAFFNISHCLRIDIFYTKYHLRTLMCRITGKDC